MEQRQFTAPGPVLDGAGRPRAGYSTRSLLRYDRRAIHASPLRIKEWDFYQISDGEKCLQFTLGHASYAGQVGIMFFDFVKGQWLARFDKLLVLPFDRLRMPSDAERDQTLTYDSGGIFMQYQTRGDTRALRCRKGDFDAEVTLTRENPNSLVINVPFAEKPTQFYYNQKINCMRADGRVRAGGREYRFDPAESFACSTGAAASGRSTTSGIGPTAPALSAARCSASTLAAALATSRPPPRICCSGAAARTSWDGLQSGTSRIISRPGT